MIIIVIVTSFFTTLKSHRYHYQHLFHRLYSHQYIKSYHYSYRYYVQSLKIQVLTVLRKGMMLIVPQ